MHIWKWAPRPGGNKLKIKWSLAFEDAINIATASPLLYSAPFIEPSVLATYLHQKCNWTACMLYGLLRILIVSSTTSLGLPFLIPISKRGGILRGQYKFKGRTVPLNHKVKEQLPFHVRSALLTTRVPVTYNVKNFKLMLITDLMIIPDYSC